MNPDEFKRAIAEKMDEIQRYRDEGLPHVVGKEAVDHFWDILRILFAGFSFFFCSFAG